MNLYTLMLAPAALLVTALCACGKPQPGRVPEPKAGPGGAAQASTAPAAGQNPLAAPGDYLRTTVGRVQEAKDAKALYEKSAADSLKSLDLNDTGGN